MYLAYYWVLECLAREYGMNNPGHYLLVEVLYMHGLGRMHSFVFIPLYEINEYWIIVDAILKPKNSC